MDARIIKKDELISFLDELIAKYLVFAPVKERGLTNFRQVESGKEACLDYDKSAKAPKEAFFPFSERLFRYSYDQGKLKIDPEQLQNEKRVLFGVHPCDARSFAILDKVFASGAYEDPYYTARRNNTYIVSLGCLKPDTTCFCTVFGISPTSSDGSDLALVALDDVRYLLQIVTEKGQELVNSFSKQPPKAKKTDLDKLKKITKQAEDAFETMPTVKELTEKLPQLFESPEWERFAERCLGCGICTWVCPTCHCFDISDDARDARGERLRSWDSCMFPQFTLHASGHNPRPVQGARIRNRIMHKFNYFLSKHSDIACVGCGRCVAGCPVNIDIREIINELSKKEPAKT